MDYAEAAQRTVAILGEPVARGLLRVLDSDSAARADVFRQLHERGGHGKLLDALADFEAEPVLREVFGRTLETPAIGRLERMTGSGKSPEEDAARFVVERVFRIRLKPTDVPG
jgi:hypothetical protein